MTTLRDQTRCFVCGMDNPQGLRARFEVDGAARAIRGVFVPRPEHEGYQGIVHGGVIAALLDEAMVKLAYAIGMPAVSAELTVKFKTPAAPGDELIMHARITRDAGKLIEAEARVERGTDIIGEAKGKLMRLP